MAVPAPSPARRARILVIDDEPMVANMLGRILGRDHDVVCTLRGRDALARIHAGEVFDLILSDLMMPEMNGADVHAALTELGLADRIIFITGGAFTSATREFLERVPNELVEKPFDPRHLRALITARLK